MVWQIFTAHALLIALLPGLAIANQNNGELEIKKIANDVYLHTSYKKLPNYGYFPSNGLVVVDGRDAYIIDTPWPTEDTQSLVQWIEDSGLTIKASISTHFHDDRSSGIAYLNSHSVKTYASELTNQLLQSTSEDKTAYSFEGEELSLLEGEIHAYYPGKGHTPDNIVVWLPASKILFGGCLIRSMSAKDLGNTADASLGDWAYSVQKVVDKFPGIEKVVPGHGALGGAELLAHTIQLAATAGSNKQE